MTITFRQYAERQNARRPTWPAALADCGRARPAGSSRRRRKSFPVIAVFAVFAAVLAATIALRLAIWLPLYFRP